MATADSLSPNSPPIDPAREHAVNVVSRLQNAGFTALWAGGCVRDFLLGIRPSDYDVATNAVPEQVRQLFGERQTLAIGAAFGVIVVRAPGGVGDVEVATFRTEGPYSDGRRPERVMFSTPEEDAQRRDFTINGLFYDPLSEQLFDYVGGQTDLQRRVLRAIGDPLERFTEDKLRILRAVRISARFGLEFDSGTAAAVRKMADQIPVVSQERIAQELRKILLHPTRRTAIERAADLGVLAIILPELPHAVADGSTAPSLATCEQVVWRETLGALNSLSSPDFELGLATLLRTLSCNTDRVTAATTAETVCRRLKLSNAETEQICWLVENVLTISELRNARLSRQKRVLGHAWARNLIAFDRSFAIARGEQPAAADACERLLDSWSEDELRPAPFVTGDDLIRMQLQPGKEFKEILATSYDAQLEGEIRSREEALFRISRRIRH